MQGERHPDVATSLNGLGSIATKRGKFSAAEKYLTEALSIRMEKLWDAHPDTARTLFNLGRLYGEQGRRRKSVSYLEMAVANVEKCLPTIRTSNSIVLYWPKRDKSRRDVELA